MRRKWQRRFAFGILLIFVSAVVLLLFAPSPTERADGEELERIVRPSPAKTPVPTPKPVIGPVRRTSAVVSVRPMHLVADLSDQRLYEMRGEEVIGKPLKISSGTFGNSTPTGSFRITRRINGWHESTLYPGGMMYKPMYIIGAVAIHGTPESNYGLLGQRASHGCIRVHQKTADYLFSKYPNGTEVVVRA